MARENRIESLRLKHARIEQRLQEEGAHVGVEDMVLQRLKFEKLRVKDEIEQLSHGQSIAA